MNIELAVVRDVGFQTDPEFAAAFYDWLHDVVNDACDVRRNVRVSANILLGNFYLVLLAHRTCRTDGSDWPEQWPTPCARPIICGELHWCP